MSRESGAALIAFVVVSLTLLTSQISAQTCPITTQKANALSFAGVKKSCGRLDSSKRSSCDDCLCSLTSTFVPALKAVGFDLEKAGGLVGAERILQSCMMVLAVPLAAAGVPLSSLLGLTQCPYDAKTYPKCVTGLVANAPEPMVNEFKTTSVESETKKSSEPESFIEEIAAECQCTSDFDPVCDYSGFWYTNYCVSKCKGAKLVEKCSPVFKEIEERDEPFTLTEKDSPFMWKAGCQCPQGDGDFDPVCDIDGKQYSSLCYANCLGANDVFDCRSLVIDFELSGDGPIIDEPPVQAQDGQVPDTVKPDITDVTDVSSPEPPAETTKSPEPEPQSELPPEVIALFTQLGVDVSAFPPELTLMAYKIIQGEQISDAELARARELMQDKERMTEARMKITPSYLQQLSLFAAGSTGNNKLLLDELVAVLSEVPATPEKDKQALRSCFNGCKGGTPVCSTTTGEEFATACHARCAGVTDTKPCYHEHDDSSARFATIDQSSALVAALLGAVAVANL